MNKDTIISFIVILICCSISFSMGLKLQEKEESILIEQPKKQLINITLMADGVEAYRIDEAELIKIENGSIYFKQYDSEYVFTGAVLIEILKEKSW